MTRRSPDKTHHERWYEKTHGGKDSSLPAYEGKGRPILEGVVNVAPLGHAVRVFSVNQAPPNTAERLAVVMVGLPARGKTFVSSKLERYFAWHGLQARVVNVGTIRRTLYGTHVTHEFFDPDNGATRLERERAADLGLSELESHFATGATVGIYDATNSEPPRRAVIVERLAARGIPVLFIEMVCDDPERIERNIREVKLHSPDYIGVPLDDAVADFRRRIEHYERIYVPLAEREGSWIRISDSAGRLTRNQIHGELQEMVVRFVGALRRTERTIFLTRHGETTFNTEDRVGGDPPLTPRGERFSRQLRAHFAERGAPAHVWSSNLQRARTTASVFPNVRIFPELREIFAGSCELRTYDEIRQHHPEEFEARRRDKLRYRYPNGESYEDLIRRLDPVILALEEETEPVLIVGHQAVIRVLFAYHLHVPRDEIPHQPVPLHRVFELHSTPYGYTSVAVDLSSPAT